MTRVTSRVKVIIWPLRDRLEDLSYAGEKCLLSHKSDPMTRVTSSIKVIIWRLRDRFEDLNYADVKYLLSHKSDAEPEQYKTIAFIYSNSSELKSESIYR